MIQGLNFFSWICSQHSLRKINNSHFHNHRRNYNWEVYVYQEYLSHYWFPLGYGEACQRSHVCVLSASLPYKTTQIVPKSGNYSHTGKVVDVDQTRWCKQSSLLLPETWLTSLLVFCGEPENTPTITEWVRMCLSELAKRILCDRLHLEANYM